MAFIKALCVLSVFSLLPTGLEGQSDVCGKVTLVNTRIVGGSSASIGAWPWQVSLHEKGFFICGGSLINNLWVLTAAHCINTTYNASDYTVYIGRHSQELLNPNEVNRTIVQIIIHPNYNQEVQYDNDMTLLKLSSAVNFTSYITPVCLAAPGSTFHNGTRTWVTGWGDTATDVLLEYPRNLTEVEVPIVGNRQCNCNYGVGSITDNMICAGLQEGGKDSCQSDSGGPLVTKQGDHWIQAGVVSFGEGCGSAGKPGVYARVSQYQSWINSTITENLPGFLIYNSSGTDGDLSVNCTTHNITITTTPTKATTTTAKPAVYCGKAPKETRLTGGGDVSSAGQWPWMASLQKNQTHVCGGTLVAEDAVLSDASCFSSPPIPSEWTVVLGRVYQNGSNPNEVHLNVSNITVSNMSGSNIAILHLASKPTLTDFIQPICLAVSNTFSEGTSCYAAGWSSVSQALQEFQTSVVNCGNATGSICTGPLNLNKSDYGGPLMLKMLGAWHQIVVLTNSATRGFKASVENFENLSNYKDFLKATLGTLLSPTPTATAAPNTPNTTNSSVAPSHSAFTLITLLCLLLWG